MTLKVGDVLVVELPGHRPPGREQEGRRPAVLVGIPPEPVRFPVLLVVPLTTHNDQAWAESNPLLYPTLEAGSGGLPSRSIALIDQLRAVDASRVSRRMGNLTKAQYKTIRDGLEAVLSPQAGR